MRLSPNNPLNNFVKKGVQKAAQEVGKRAPTMPTMAQVKQKAIQGAMQGAAKMSSAKQQIVQGATQGAAHMSAVKQQVVQRASNMKQQALNAASKQVAKLPNVKQMAIQHATQQVAKHGPTAINAGGRFLSGVKSGVQPIPSLPSKDPIKAAGEVTGGLGSELANRKIKSGMTQGVNKVNQTASNLNQQR